MNWYVLETTFRLIFRWIVIGFFILAIIVFLCGICCFGEITGPDVVPTGRLAVFTSDLDGSYSIIPTAKDCWDVSGRKFYFASPEKTKYTLIHCGLKDKQPVLSTFEFTVGDVSPILSPTLSASDKSAALEAMRQVITGIDEGTIRTPQGARSVFKTVLIRAVGNCQNGTCTLSPSLSAAVERWESTMDVTTLDGIRQGFDTTAKELKGE